MVPDGAAGAHHRPVHGGQSLSGIVGGPLTGLIMQSFGGIAGLASWQWLFIVEGIPA